MSRWSSAKGAVTKNETVELDGSIGLIFSNGKIVYVDKEDYHLVENYRWCESAHAREKTSYARTSITTPAGKKTTIQMHQILLPTELNVDHIDGDGLNNRRSNLREATREQNQHNRKKPINNTSGYIGVDWRPKQNKWRAKIRADNKTLQIGLFDSLEEAVAARDAKALELRGEWAKLNASR